MAPGIFQSLMERLMQRILDVVPYFDHSLVAPANRTDLLQRLRLVLGHFRDVSLKLKREKCHISVPG